MHARGKSLLLLAGLSVLLLVAGCDSGDSEPPEPDRCEDPDALNTGEVGECEYPTEPDMVEISATLTAESGELSNPEITFGDETVSGSEATRTFEESDDELTVTGTADGFVAQSQTVTLSADREIAFTLEVDTPEDVEIEFTTRAAAGDSVLTDATVSGAAEGTGQFTATLPFGTGELCVTGEAQYFESAEKCFTPDADQTVEINMEREMISASVNVDPSDALITITEPGGNVRDGSEATGSVSTTLPKRAGERQVLFSLDGHSDETMTVSAAASISESVELERVYACNNGIDDDGDGFVDAKDAGCVDGFDGFATDSDGNLINYDRDDDNEVLKAFRTQIGIGSEDTLKVSSDGPLEVLWRNVGSPLPLSVKAAIGEVELYMDTGRESNQDEEAVAIRLETGESHRNTTYENTTEVVPDDNEQDSFELTQFHGVDRNWFPDGRFFNVYVRHGCDVAGNPLNLSCDGDDDVVLILPASLPGNQRVSLSFFFRFEEEEVPGGESAATLQATELVYLSAQEMNRRIEEK